MAVLALAVLALAVLALAVLALAVLALAVLALAVLASFALVVVLRPFVVLPDFGVLAFGLPVLLVPVLTDVGRAALFLRDEAGGAAVNVPRPEDDEDAARAADAAGRAVPEAVLFFAAMTSRPSGVCGTSQMVGVRISP